MYDSYFFCCSSVLEDCKWGSDRIEYFTKHFLVGMAKLQAYQLTKLIATLASKMLFLIVMKKLLMMRVQYFLNFNKKYILHMLLLAILPCRLRELYAPVSYAPDEYSWIVDLIDMT